MRFLPTKSGKEQDGIGWEERGMGVQRTTEKFVLKDDKRIYIRTFL